MRRSAHTELPENWLPYCGAGAGAPCVVREGGNVEGIGGRYTGPDAQ